MSDEQDFIQGYVAAALWTTTDQDLADLESGSGPSLDKEYAIGDLDSNLLASLEKDCRDFMENNTEDLEKYYEVVGKGPHDAGYCFWMERSGDGVSFTDFGYPGKEGYEAAERLSEHGKMYSHQDWYAHEGQILASGLEVGAPALESAKQDPSDQQALEMPTDRGFSNEHPFSL